MLKRFNPLSLERFKIGLLFFHPNYVTHPQRKSEIRFVPHLSTRSYDVVNTIFFTFLFLICVFIRTLLISELVFYTLSQNATGIQDRTL